MSESFFNPASFFFKWTRSILALGWTCVVKGQTIVLGCSSFKRLVWTTTTGLVLPGVAAFGYAVNALGNLAGPIKKAAAAGKPLLGICVGHQLLFDQSCEHGRHNGLALVHGNIVPIPTGRTIPHMGWNLV